MVMQNADECAGTDPEYGTVRDDHNRSIPIQVCGDFGEYVGESLAGFAIGLATGHPHVVTGDPGLHLFGMLLPGFPRREALTKAEGHLPEALIRLDRYAGQRTERLGSLHCP